MIRSLIRLVRSLFATNASDPDRRVSLALEVLSDRWCPASLYNTIPGYSGATQSVDSFLDTSINKFSVVIPKDPGGNEIAIWERFQDDASGTEQDVLVYTGFFLNPHWMGGGTLAAVQAPNEGLGHSNNPALVAMGLPPNNDAPWSVVIAPNPGAGPYVELITTDATGAIVASTIYVSAYGADYRGGF